MTNAMQAIQIRKDILEFIRNYWQKNYAAPTYRDIMENCDISSTSIVMHHLDVMEAQGMIVRAPGVGQRNIRPANMRITFTSFVNGDQDE